MRHVRALAQTSLLFALLSGIVYFFAAASPQVVAITILGTILLALFVGCYRIILHFNDRRARAVFDAMRRT